MFSFVQPSLGGACMLKWRLRPRVPPPMGWLAHSTFWHLGTPKVRCFWFLMIISVSNKGTGWSWAMTRVEKGVFHTSHAPGSPTQRGQGQKARLALFDGQLPLNVSF